jgi:hypothetical protein
LEQKFAKLAEMVPQVWKLTEMAPEHLILEEKVNNDPWEFTSYHNWSLEEKFKEFTSLVPEL